MQDIVDKIDRAKAIVGSGEASDGVSDDMGRELINLAIDAVGELLANSRRIAVALEAMPRG